jgi:hypothetical protein
MYDGHGWHVGRLAAPDGHHWEIGRRLGGGSGRLPARPPS